ncbi:MAG: hypothetical protein U0835_17765 [Isosphaeraceae bacterium]
MANFRCERLYVMLDEPVPGLDHLRAVDPVEFAHLGSDDDAERLGVTPLSDFTFAPFERKRWRHADEGLKTVRALIRLYQDEVALTDPGREPRNQVLSNQLVVLAQVEAVLDAASARGRRFYLAAKDLA